MKTETLAELKRREIPFVVLSDTYRTGGPAALSIGGDGLWGTPDDRIWGLHR